MKRSRLFLFSCFYFFLIILASVYGAGCDCGMDTTGVGDGNSDGGGNGGGTTGGDDGSGDEGDTGDGSGTTGGDTGSGSISSLPDGVAISGTVNGESVQVSDSEIDVFISNFDAGLDVIFSIGVSNESSSSSQKILVYLSLSNRTLIDSFTVGTTYELNATELGVTNLGSIRVTSTDGTTQTYLIDSALLQFSELNNENGGAWSGIMQVSSSSSNTKLTVDFSGAISFITA